MRTILIAALLGCTALILSACGEQQSGGTKADNAVRETAAAVDKTADHAVGKAQLEQKKKMENKLNAIQQKHQKQYDQAVKNQ